MKTRKNWKPKKIMKTNKEEGHMDADEGGKRVLLEDKGARRKGRMGHEALQMHWCSRISKR